MTPDGASAMVVLASEPLGPNLQGLVCYKARNPGRRHLKIYVPSDERRSRDPARRLENFRRTHFQDIKVELSGEPLPLAEITRELVRTGADGKEAFRRVNDAPAGEQRGFLFERYAGAAPRERGLRNVARNATATSREGKRLQEIDLVANRGGRLTILDCRLTSKSQEEVLAEPTIRQIRTAEVSRRHMGMAGAQVTMIRPGRRFDEAERALAEALRVQAIDQSEVQRLFTPPAGLYEQVLPKSLVQAERLLAVHPFVLTRSMTGEPPRPEGRGQGMALFDKLIGRQRWAAWVLCGRGYFACVKPAPDPEETFIRRVACFLSPFGKGSIFSKGPELLQFEIQPSNKAALKKLSCCLEKLMGRDFLREAPVSSRPGGSGGESFRQP